MILIYYKFKTQEHEFSKCKKCSNKIIFKFNKIKFQIVKKIDKKFQSIVGENINEEYFNNNTILEKINNQQNQINLYLENQLKNELNNDITEIFLNQLSNYLNSTSNKKLLWKFITEKELKIKAKNPNNNIPLLDNKLKKLIFFKTFCINLLYQLKDQDFENTVNYILFINIQMKENFSNFYFKLNDLLISILAETLKHKSIELFYKIEHRSIDFIRNQEKATYDMFINLEEIFSRTENSQLLQSVINFSQEDLILFFKLQELKNLLYPNEKIPEVLDLILFNLLKILKNQNVELYYNFKNWEKVYNKIEYYNIPESDYNLFFEENNINKNSLFFACWLKKKENEAIQKYKKIYSIHLTNFNNIKKLQFNDQKMLNFLLVEMHKIALEFRKKKKK